MLALGELAKSWPVGCWIMRLFVNPMRRMTEQGFGFENANANINVNIGGNGQKTLNVSTSQNLSSKSVESNLGAAPDIQGKITTPSSLAQYSLHPQQQQQIDPMLQSADQLIPESLWADNGFDLDFLFQNASIPILSASDMML